MKNNYQSRAYIVAVIVIGLLLIFSIKSLAAVTTTPLPYFQDITITGIITDKDGLPVPGATVSIKDTNNGTLTEMEGTYNITAPAGATLVISYLGFKSREVAVDGRKEIDIQLEEDVQALGAVEINAGYYNTTERERTGNISRVTAEEIELQPVVSPLQALQGRMAGVEVTPGGSNPGTASTIRIRGINSLREEGNFPLYIIDGVPIISTPVETNSIAFNAGLDPLNTLNVSNIESIEVLKDADATAIYGSRGANGVVLITTKTDKQRGTGLEARVYTGASTVPNRLDLLNTEEYLRVRRKAFENDGLEPDANNAYDLVLWDQDRYTDWQEFLFGGTSSTTNANLVFSGGNENTSFRLGGSYFSQGTVYPGDFDYNKVTGNFSLRHTSYDQKFNINLSVNYGIDINNLVGNVGFSSIARLPPNAPAIFNEDGTLNWSDWTEAGLDNPLNGYYNSSTTNNNNFISNILFSYKIYSGLSFKTSLGYTNNWSEEILKLPARSSSPADVQTNNSSHLNSNRKSWILEPQLNYEKDFGKLNLQSIMGATLQENSSSNSRFRANGYVSEALIGNLTAAETIVNAASENTEYRYSALFARIGMNWDRKYFINLTGRRDGSSRFGPNNRFANFGAVGAAWIFSEEAVIKKNLSFLSFGKLRGSYGTTGNDQIGDYGYLDAYEATAGPGGLYPSALANPDYSWEVNKKLEGAIELAFFSDRIRLGLSWYRNKSSNQLVGYALPSMTGFSSVQANLPATVENSGWELEASTINFETKNFRWQTSFNVSFPRNKLIDYPDIEQSSYANTYRIGHPLNINLGYEYDGLDPETGFYAIRDINEDGSFDYQDRNVIIDRNSEFFGGINNTLSFKKFSLQFLWQFEKKNGSHSLFNAGRPLNPMVDILGNLDGESKFQKISQSSQAGTAFNNVLNTTFPIQDASFLRLQSLSFGYNIPRKSLERIGFKRCKLFIHGQNLLTITPYGGMDPQLSLSGIEIGNLRTVSGGVQINL